MARFRICAAAAGAVIAALLVVTACSSSSTSGAGGATASSQGVLKIGLAAPTNNAVISDPYSISGAQAAIRAINASGGLAGHKLQLDYCNDQVDPNQTIICARKFVSDKVIAIAGGDVTNDALFVPILEKAGIPMIGFNPYTQFTAKNLYLYNGGSIFGYSTLAAYAQFMKIPTSLVVSGSTAGLRTATSIETAMKNAGGKFLSTTLVQPTQADYAPIVASALTNGAKAVLVVLGQSQQDQFISAAAASDSTLKFFTGYEIGPSDQKALARVNMANIIYTSPFPPITADSSYIKQFATDLAAEKAAGDAEADEALHNFHGVGAWLAVKIIQKLVQQDSITNVNAQTITNALNSAKDLNLGGIIPPWTPAKAGVTGYPRLSSQSQYVIGYTPAAQPQMITAQPITLANALALKFP